MDEEIEDIRRRIAEAHGVQRRLTQMQLKIRQQHDRLEHALRGFQEEERPAREPLVNGWRPGMTAGAAAASRKPSGG